VIPLIVWELIVVGGGGRFPKVIPAKTMVMTNTETTNLFCLTTWDIRDHITVFKVVEEIEESSEWFNRTINSFE
jgi:hypothetical protein